MGAEREGDTGRGPMAVPTVSAIIRVNDHPFMYPGFSLISADSHEVSSFNSAVFGSNSGRISTRVSAIRNHNRPIATIQGCSSYRCIPTFFGEEIFDGFPILPAIRTPSHHQMDLLGTIGDRIDTSIGKTQHGTLVNNTYGRDAVMTAFTGNKNIFLFDNSTPCP